MTTPNYRKASIYFDDETVLEVEQRGGGGSGVGGDTGLSAVNLITGESTNDALAEKDETIEEQAGTIEEQEATIETQAGTISDLEDEVAAKQATIDELTTELATAWQFGTTASYTVTFVNNGTANIIAIMPNSCRPISDQGRPTIDFVPHIIPAGGSEVVSVALGLAAINQHDGLPFSISGRCYNMDGTPKAISQATIAQTSNLISLSASPSVLNSGYVSFIINQNVAFDRALTATITIQ